MRIPRFIIALMVLMTCSGSSEAREAASQPSKSPEVIQIIDLALASGEHLYILEYRTTLPIAGVARLAEEAETLWPILRPQAEAAGHASAGIRAVAQSGEAVVQEAQAYTFIWEKNRAGEWRRLEDEG